MCYWPNTREYRIVKSGQMGDLEKARNIREAIILAESDGHERVEEIDGMS